MLSVQFQAPPFHLLTRNPAHLYQNLLASTSQSFRLCFWLCKIDYSRRLPMLELEAARSFGRPMQPARCVPAPSRNLRCLGLGSTRRFPFSSANRLRPAHRSALLRCSAPSPRVSPQCLFGPEYLRSFWL